MDYVFEYLVFLAQAITVVAAVLVVAGGMTAMSQRRRRSESGRLEVTKINDRLEGLRDSLREALLEPAALKKLHRRERKAARARSKAKARSETRDAVAKGGRDEAASASEAGGADGRHRVFVIDFDGDLQASQVDALRQEITAVLSLARPEDEVVLRLESPGGLVPAYGLAASQLDRVRQQGVPLTVVVDKVAASGGYLMAAVADRLLAAPFALVGSIGVVAQVPNVHRLLKKHDVDVEVLTAGKYKRTLTVLGENTEEGRSKFIEELEDVHALFQEYVGQRRPQVELERVATGEVWYGSRAVALKLVDDISTSDDYLVQASAERDVFEVHWVEHRKPIERLLAQAEQSVRRLLLGLGMTGGRA